MDRDCQGLNVVLTESLPSHVQSNKYREILFFSHNKTSKEWFQFSVFSSLTFYNDYDYYYVVQGFFFIVELIDMFIKLRKHKLEMDPCFQSTEP